MTEQIFHDSHADLSHRAKWWTGRIAIYGALVLWAFICLFPIYWTITTSFIFREYRERSNVGYGTMLAMVYLVVIIIAMTVLMKIADRWTRPRT